MKIKKRIILPSLALLLASNLYASKLYTVETTSLQDAISKISKTADIPYLVDTNILKGKKSKSIKNVEGLENAFKSILKGTGLESVIENNMIIIKEKKRSKTQNSSKTSLGEVTITGTKLNKSLQETVESVQVFNDVDITNGAKMNDLSDIFEQTSSVSKSESFGVIIRGIDSTGFGGGTIGPRTIDVNIDGVSQSFDAARIGSTTWDLEQVEILKGPQSTTQGRNALAGAIILKTKNPEFEANGAARVDYSTNNTSRLSVVQTGPITDKLAFRVSAERSATDGFVENDVLNDDKFNESKSSNLRGKLLYQFDNGADAILTVNRVKTNEDGTSEVEDGTNDTTNVNSPFERKSEDERDGYRNADVKSYSLEINLPINNNWSSKSITSYTDSEYDADSDRDGLDGDEYRILERNVDDFAQEFRFSYKKDKLNALLGLYLATGSSVYNQDNLNDDLTSAAGGLFLDSVTDLSEDYNNIALFTNIDYKITDKLTLIAGLRIDRDKRTIKGSTSAERLTDYSTDTDALVDYIVQDTDTFSAITDEATALGFITSTGGGSVAAGTAGIGSSVNVGVDDLIDESTNQDIEEDNVTTNILPKLGLNYKWNNNINTGILFSQGYRTGGISVDLTTAGSSSYDAEFTDNVEFSFRSKWLENTLTLNANVFYTKYKDIQVSQENDSGDNVITNAGEASLKGIELDTKYLINDELDIYGSIGYIKTKFEDYDGFNGNEFADTPSITANIGTTYRHHSGYFIGGNITYNDDSYSDSDNTTTTKSYTLTNVKVGYEKDDWAMYLYSNNLFDKDYLTRNTISTDSEDDIGNPRVIGVTLTYNW